MHLIDPSARIALVALLHDLGKLAERAGIARKFTDRANIYGN